MLNDLAAILRRRKYHIAIPFIVILSLSIGLAYMLPPVYRSTATILIEQQEIPDNLVSTTVTGYAAERIERIRNRVMAKSNLLDIVKEFNLYPEIIQTGDEQEAMSRMKEDMGLEMVSAEAQDPRNKKSVMATIAFSVYYENPSPQTAQQVTAKLAELYLAENRRSRTEKTRTTSAFLAAEAQRLGTEISDLEARLANFKIQNADQLPESVEQNQNARHAAMLERNRISANIRSLVERRNFLRDQISQFGVGGKLAQAQQELTLAREKYSEIHPDTVRLKRTVATLKAELESARQGNAPTQAGAYDKDPEYNRLLLMLQEVLGELGSSQSQLRNLESSIATYDERLGKSPEVERQYSALTRDLDNATKKYREIRDKLTQARLAEELELEQKAERFTLINKADLPATPIRPNRIGIVLLGIMFSLGSGIGLAALAEYFDRRIYSPRDLAAVFRAPPLGTIPEIAVVDSRRWLAVKITMLVTMVIILGYLIASQGLFSESAFSHLFSIGNNVKP